MPSNSEYSKFESASLERPSGEQSRATEESFQLLVESVKDYGIFMLSPLGTILTWNAGAERIKGYSAGEVIGKHFQIFYTEEARNRNHPAFELAEAIREGRYEEEGWRVRKDGTQFWASVVITHLVSSTGKTVGFGKVTRDLTERKRSEEALRNSEERLKAANESLERRVQQRTKELSKSNFLLRTEVEQRVRTEQELTEAVRSRDEFLSIASHELRTPVTPLKIQLQVLLAHLKRGSLSSLTPERLMKMAHSLDRSLDRLTRLMDNLLDVARINSGKIKFHPEELELSELAAEIVTRFQHLAEASGSTLAIDVADKGSVMLDPIRFEQVLSNLLTNAIKFGFGKSIHLHLSYNAEWLRLEVRDHGVGIMENDLARIFSRFEQVSQDSEARGLGLGLYITKQIVDAQGGTIFVKSKLHEGSTFVVELPLVAKSTV